MREDIAAAVGAHTSLQVSPVAYWMNSLVLRYLHFPVTNRKINSRNAKKENKNQLSCISKSFFYVIEISKENDDNMKRRTQDECCPTT